MKNNITEIHERVYLYLTEDLKDQNLRFTLRVKNIANRIDKGYWFFGNDSYLAFSFWKGLDWRNKTPNIYFAISKEGHCSLDFVSYDEENKINFLTELAETLEMKQLNKARNKEKINHWIKHFSGTDYLASLDSFLKRDKKIIDAFIKGSEQIKNILSPIENEVFLKAKERIEYTRKVMKTTKWVDDTIKKYKQLSSKIKLESISFENISVFANSQTLKFHENLTCLIGLNGTGKTSILRAIVLAFIGYEQSESLGFSDSLLTNRLQNLLHISGVEKGHTIYPPEGGYVELKYIIGPTNAIESNKVLFTVGENGEPQLQDEGIFKSVEGDRLNCLLLAFPQVHSEDATFQKDRKIDPNLDDVITMLNNKPDNRFGSFVKWLCGLNRIANDKQVKGDSSPLERRIITDIFSIISAVTDETISLQDVVVKDNGEEDIWVKLGSDTSPILLNLVSQGYNNVFGWVGYFMQRLYDVTPKEGKIKETPAIVLIDEIDTYLHPKWQHKILAVLVEEFPKVQFIVTTHSPYILGSIPNSKINIYICANNEGEIEVEEFTEFTPYGADLERLSKRIFKTPPRIERIEKAIEALELIIGNSDPSIFSTQKQILKSLLPDFSSYKDEDDPLTFAEKGIQALKSITSLNDAELLSLESFIRTKKRLKERQHAIHH